MHGPGDVDSGGFSSFLVNLCGSLSFFSVFSILSILSVLEDVALSLSCRSSLLDELSGFLAFDFTAVKILVGGDTSLLVPVLRTCWYTMSHLCRCSLSLL